MFHHRTKLLTPMFLLSDTRYALYHYPEDEVEVFNHWYIIPQRTERDTYLRM